MSTHTYTQNNKKYRGSIQRRLWSKMLITQIIVRAGMTSQRGPAVYGLLQSKTSGVSSLRAPSPWRLAGRQHESVGVFFNRSSSLTPLLVRNDSLQSPGLAILTYVGEDLDKQEEGILVCFLVAVINITAKSNLGEERACFILHFQTTVISWEESGKKLRQGPNQKLQRMLHTGLLCDSCLQ